MTISHSILAAAKAGEPRGETGPVGSVLLEPSRASDTKLASEPKLCKDCRYADAKGGVWFCSHPDLLRMDYVSGNHQPGHCSSLRDPGPRPPFVRECGPEARYWEAK